MEEFKLNAKEQLKYETIKELLEHGGNKKEVAQKLNISVRQVNRLIIKYNEKGKAGFYHGNHFHRPPNALPQDLTDKIISLYEGPYQGYNFNHFKVMLEKNEGITLSYTALYNLLTSRGYISCKAQSASKQKALKEQ